MDYCIPHMLFFKCLILTEYKTLEYSLSTRLLKELCVGHHSHISLNPNSPEGWSMQPLESFSHYKSYIS